MGQFDALLFKQWILTKRQRVSFCCQIFTPMFSLGLIFAIQYIVQNTDIAPPDAAPFPGADPNGLIPAYVHLGYRANSNGLFEFAYKNDNRYRILVYSGLEKLNQSVEAVLSENVPVTQDIDPDTGVLYPKFNRSSYSDTQQCNEVLISHLRSARSIPNSDLQNYQGIPDGMLMFNDSDFTKGMNIHLQTNNVVGHQLHRRNGISYIVLAAKNSKNRSFAFTTPTEGYTSTLNYMNNKFMRSKCPQDKLKGSILSIVSPTTSVSSVNAFIDQGITSLSIVFFPIALAMGFPLLLYSLVLESEEKILTILKINGLQTRTYWTSIYLFYFALFTVTTTIFSVLGWIFLDITFFTKLSGVIITCFFIAWNISQISFGIFLSTLISSSIYANLVGYLTSVLLILALSGISFSVFANPSPLPVGFYILPHSAFVRFFYSVSFDCVNDKCPKGIFSMSRESTISFWMLWVASLVYSVLAFVVKKYRLVEYFTSQPAAEEPTTGVKTPRQSVTGDISSGVLSIDVTTNLLDHQDSGKETPSNLDADKYAVLAANLTKVYPNGKKALVDFSIKIKKDKIFGLLGPNGAGKTTFLSILTGALEKTSGLIYFEGEQVVYGERRDAKIGFCPQFDILWPSLNVIEHFQFYTKFKDYQPPEGLETYIAKMVANVDLTKDSHKLATQLSGGMRRRVSLGNAVSGNPTVIFLDEPSSGLDPVRRREFWDLIKKVGVGKAVVLTTHLMEEADTLSDEIGIMTAGELRAIGTPNFLKEKYGNGLKMQIVVTKLEVQQQVTQLLSERFSTCAKTWEFDRAVTYTLNDTAGQPGSAMLKVFEIARQLQSQGLLEDWSVTRGSLEEVFLRVIHLPAK